MHEDRTKGYLNAMEEANLKTEVIKSKMDFESQVEFLEKYIDKIKKLQLYLYNKMYQRFL